MKENGKIINRNGQGTYTWLMVTIYEGEWKDDKQDGQWKMKWSNGNIYEGEWKDDIKNGKGHING